MAGNIVLKSFAWTISIVTIFVLILGSVAISLVTGLWVYDNTNLSVAGWVVGILVMVFFLATVGAGIGVWLWLRGPTHPNQHGGKLDSLETVLQDMIDKD